MDAARTGLAAVLSATQLREQAITAVASLAEAMDLGGPEPPAPMQDLPSSSVRASSGDDEALTRAAHNAFQQSRSVEADAHSLSSELAAQLRAAEDDASAAPICMLGGFVTSVLDLLCWELSEAASHSRDRAPAWSVVSAEDVLRSAAVADAATLPAAAFAPCGALLEEVLLATQTIVRRRGPESSQLSSGSTTSAAGTGPTAMDETKEEEEETSMCPQVLAHHARLVQLLQVRFRDH